MRLRLNFSWYRRLIHIHINFGISHLIFPLSSSLSFLHSLPFCIRDLPGRLSFTLKKKQTKKKTPDIVESSSHCLKADSSLRCHLIGTLSTQAWHRLGYPAYTCNMATNLTVKHAWQSATQVTSLSRNFHQDVWWSWSVSCIIFSNLSQCVRKRWLSSRRTIICLGERPLSKLRSFCTDVGRKFWYQLLPSKVNLFMYRLRA